MYIQKIYKLVYPGINTLQSSQLVFEKNVINYFVRNKILKNKKVE